MSKQPTNPSSHQFSAPKDLPPFQPDLQSRLMFPLQGQLSRKAHSGSHPLLHVPPDTSELNMYNPTKKFKPDDNPLNMLMDPATAMSLFPTLTGQNKPSIEIPTAKDPLSVPELRSLGFEPQQQAFRPGKGRTSANLGFPGFENPGRGQLSHLSEVNYPNLSSLLPDARAAEELLLNSQRDQALRNMLVMQALQNPNDLLTSRYLQAQAQAQVAQQQAQLLGHPSFQASQGIRLPGFNGVNPMTLQYLELQKRLQNDYALMQAQQAAQAMQAAQRLQGGDWSQQAQALSDSLGGRFRLDGGLGENLVKLESGLQFPTGLESQLRMMYNEGLDRPIRRDEIPELYERLGREPEVKKEDTDHHLGQQHQQALRHQHQLQQQQQLQHQQHLQHQQQLQQQRQEEKLQARKNAEKPANGFVQMEREVRPQKEVKIEQPRPEPKVVQQQQQRVPPRIEPMEEEQRGKSNARGRGRPARELPTKVTPPPVVIENPRTRETRRNTNRAPLEIQPRYELDSDEEEEKIVPARRSNGARLTRNSSKKLEPLPIVKPVVSVPATTTVKPPPPQDIGSSIIQPKEQFASRLLGGYLIEVYLPKEKVKTTFKRTPVGRAHQVGRQECELNEEVESPVVIRQPCKLISAPVYNPEDDIEDIQLTPLDPKVPHIIRSKEIKVGEAYQAYIDEFELNAEIERPQRSCKLISSPENVQENHIEGRA